MSHGLENAFHATSTKQAG